MVCALNCVCVTLWILKNQQKQALRARRWAAVGRRQAHPLTRRAGEEFANRGARKVSSLNISREGFRGPAGQQRMAPRRPNGAKFVGLRGEGSTAQRPRWGPCPAAIDAACRPATGWAPAPCRGQSLIRRRGLGQAQLARIVAAEGAAQFTRHALLQGLGTSRTDLVQEREQQPAPHAPGHAEIATEGGGRGVQPAIQVHLLVHRRAIAAVFARVAAQRRLHGRQDLAGQGAATGGVKGQGGAGLHQGLGQVVGEAVGAAVAHLQGALPAQQRRLGRRAHDVDQAAAVCTRAVWPSRRIVSTMPKAVSGLTKHEAPSAAVASSGSRRHWLRGTQRYWAYIAPPMAATFLPSRAWAAAEVPAATTVPAPSLPTGSDCPTRAAMAGMAATGTWALSTGRSGLPAACTVPRSAAPSSRP